MNMLNVVKTVILLNSFSNGNYNINKYCNKFLAVFTLTMVILFYDLFISNFTTIIPLANFYNIKSSQQANS